jgi:threonine aldolase
MIVDLRSDTITRPTEAMRAAMASAPVGDDVYGEDPTVNRLEETVAALLGHEAALFTPTGSMANQLGVRTLVPIGKELLCDSQAHVVRAELGAHAAFTGLTTRTFSTHRGVLDLDVVASMVEPESGPYTVPTAAIAVENTHNFGGGSIQPIERLASLRSLADSERLRLHLDGARLWNAHVATGVGLDTYGRLFDTVSVCLSKGLGAPVGSVLVSTRERIAEARIWRKRLGGGMRQAGIIAAAGLFALEHHLDRLADDHKRAKRLAEFVGVDPNTVETNIVVIEVPDAKAVVAACGDEQVLVGAVGPRRVRLLTHLDVDDEGIERAGDVLARVLHVG